MSGYSLGIDFGTTNTVLALADAEGSESKAANDFLEAHSGLKAAGRLPAYPRNPAHR